MSKTREPPFDNFISLDADLPKTDEISFSFMESLVRLEGNHFEVSNVQSTMVKIWKSMELHQQ